MKAAVLSKGSRMMELEDLHVPTIREDEVLIKVVACGVCHTDLKVIQGSIPYVSPSVIGHEVSGTVEQVGAQYKEVFRENDPVIVGTRYKCGRCGYCVKGRENLCQNRPQPSPLRREDGSKVNRWNVGGFAQYVVVPGYMVYPIPEGVDLVSASVIGCRVSTAYYAVRHAARVEVGESAVVLGCGGVGLNAIQLLRYVGANPIVAVDIVDEKLEAAKTLGATHVINGSRENVTKSVREITDGGADKAFEAIGNPQTAGQLVDLTRPGGTAVIIGALGPEPFTLSSGMFAFNEITVTGVAMRRPADVIEVLQLVRDGRITVDPLITQRYPYEEINRAFRDLEAGRVLIGVTLWS